MKVLPVVAAIALAAAACGSMHRVKVVDDSATRPARAPTKYSCAAAWNRSVPRSALAWARRSQVWQGTVEAGLVSQVTVAWGGGQAATTTAQREGQTCTITLFAPHGDARMILGTWRGGGVSGWTSLRPSPQVPAGGGNACVARDGAIRPLGSFTASSRCPHSGVSR